MKIHRAFYDAIAGKWLTNVGALRVGNILPVVAGDINLFQFQAVKGPAKFLDNGRMDNPYDLSLWGTNALFGWKTEADWLAGGDFTGFGVGFLDDAWHDLNYGAGTVPCVVAVAHATAAFQAGLNLYDSINNRFQFGDAPIRLEVTMPVATGSESNLPNTIGSPLTGTAQITGSNTTKVVALPGMTEDGFVSVWLVESTAGQTIPWVSNYAEDAFTVKVGAAPEVETGDGLVWNIGWQVLKKS
jgi:hypothetical protein